MSAEPGRAYSWYVLSVLTVIYIASFVDRVVLSLLIAPIQRDLQINDTQISLVAGLAFAIFFTTVGLPIGRLADRYSRRLIIATGAVLWSLATAACGLASTFGQLFAARVAVGIGEATLTPAAYSLLSDYFPPERLGRAISLYFAGTTIGAGLAFMVGGGVVHYASGMADIVLPAIGALRPWQLVFVYVALPGILLTTLMATVKEPRTHQQEDLRSATIVVPIREFISFVWIRRRFFAAHFLGVGVLSMFVNGLLVWTPTMFERKYGWEAQEIGIAFGALLALFGTLGAFVSGWLADWYTRRGRADSIMRVMSVASLASAPIWISMPLVADSRACLALLALTVFGGWASFSVAPAALQLVTPPRMRAQISAVYLLFVTGLGLGVGPTTIAAITDYVFAEAQALPYSVAIVGGAAALVGSWFLWLGRAEFVKWRLDLGVAVAV